MANLHFLAGLIGSFESFPRTRGEREKNADARKSIRERYASRQDYLDRVQKAVEQLVRLEHMGEKSAEKLVDAIAASKDRELWRLINGLGISNVGERAAQKLAEHFRGLDALASASLEELQRVPDVGPVMAQGIHDFFRNPNNQAVIDKLRKAGVKMRA